MTRPRHGSVLRKLYMIKFHCFQCGQKISVPDGSVGKRARCPKCSTVLTVPAAGVSKKGTASDQTTDFRKKSTSKTQFAFGRRSTSALVRFRCVMCNASITAPESKRGQIILCPHCRANSEVPLKSLQVEKKKEPESPLKELTKKCHFCGEEVLEVAKKCKHCGEYLVSDAAIVYSAAFGQDLVSSHDPSQLKADIASTKGPLHWRLLRELWWLVPAIMMGWFLFLKLGSMPLILLFVSMALFFRVIVKKSREVGTRTVVAAFLGITVGLTLIVGVIIAALVYTFQISKDSKTEPFKDTRAKTTSASSRQKNPSEDFELFAASFMRKMHSKVKGFSTSYSLDLRESGNLLVPYIGTIETKNLAVTYNVRFSFQGNSREWQYVQTRSQNIILGGRWWDEWESEKTDLFHRAAKLCMQEIAY